MRGFWHILEAVIAGMIVMLFLTTLVKQPTAGTAPKDLTEQAYQLLHGLEKQEALRTLAANNDAVGVASAVRYAAANRTAQVCDYDGACAGGRPNATQVWSGTYIFAGRNSYSPREVRLYLSNP